MEASALHAPVGIGRVSISAPLLRLRPDDQLVALFRAGNEEAFRVIHDRYRQRLFAYTRQMLSGSKSDAEDALQDVFVRAYSALRADARPLMLRAWLYRVAHNRCIDQLRRPVPPPSEVFEMSRGPLADPIEQSERREDLRRLVADVRKLPEQQRSALLMREMEGLSYAQLASALDVSVPAVKSLLVRARVSLVEAIEARDTDCVEIQNDIAAAMDRGVRANGRVRRHVRECSGCKDYNTRLRGVQRSFNELSPGHGFGGFLAKLLGIGGAGSGAAAGGTAAGGGAAAAGTGAVAVTATKVAAIVCCAALTAGGAAELSSTTAAHHHGPVISHVSHSARASGGVGAIAAPSVAIPVPSVAIASSHVAHAAVATATVTHQHVAPVHHATHLRATKSAAPAAVTASDPATATEPTTDSDGSTSGGVRAPDEDDSATTTTDPTTDPAATPVPVPAATPSPTGTAASAGTPTASDSTTTTATGTSAGSGATTAPGPGPTATTTDATATPPVAQAASASGSVSP